MITVPEATPPATPVTGLMVAIDVLSLAHEPPLTGFVKVIVEPWQTLPGPPMVPGAGVTVTVILAEHPVPSE
jgi:hypothetical protein